MDRDLIFAVPSTKTRVSVDRIKTVRLIKTGQQIKYIYIIRHAAPGPSLFKVIEIIKTEAAKSMSSHNRHVTGTNIEIIFSRYPQM